MSHAAGRFQHVLEHLQHILPSQAPLRDFVHHNTLHGFQHLAFPEALKSAHEITGAYGYLPAQKFREYYQQGRIEQADLEAVLAADEALAAQDELLQVAGQSVPRMAVYLTALLHPVQAISPARLAWEVEENAALEQQQDLWQACLQALELQQHELRHAEELLQMAPEQATQLFAHSVDAQQADIEQQLADDARQRLLNLSRQVGKEITLRGLLLRLTGEDILQDIRPLLLRQLATWLDQGMAAWQPQDTEQGLYASWRRSSQDDLSHVLEDIPDWVEYLHSLPDEPEAAIVTELQRLGIPEEDWDAYLTQLALELPGWSGMMLWRHDNPEYVPDGAAVNMLDYLAIRLGLEHLFARRLCRRIWLIDATLDDIRWHFSHYPGELVVRYYLFNHDVPEYLLSLAQPLLGRCHPRTREAGQWRLLAHQVWTWAQSPSNPQRAGGWSVYDHGWRLFQLAQHLHWDAASVQQLSKAQLDTLFDCLQQLDAERSGFIWLQAYERHYREQIFNALVNNHGRGDWAKRRQRPQAQVVFCMDEREEGIRRHLEELNPYIETLGAAAFFNLPMNWQGLDDKAVTKLCPVPVTPVHLVREVAQQAKGSRHQQHVKRHSLRTRWTTALQHMTRHRLGSGTLGQVLLAPLALLALLAKSYMPRRFGQWLQGLTQRFEVPVNTKLEFIAPQQDEQRSRLQNQLGFTDAEQAEKVGGFLRTIGLVQGFAPLVVIMGHGSSSQNNPHSAAYECGACSGRHSGPNARVFAAMANRPVVRKLLAEQGLPIPEDTWFMGAEHDTCDEHIPWYDVDAVPAALYTAVQQLQQEIHTAAQHSAHERCRKLASAPRKPSLPQAIHHIAGRAFDYSQARPELGHATNACALIGRRSVTRGSFLDRRCFLISYDYNTDPSGTVLENILLSAGPVGAGINLEYYFSTVNNAQYGSGSKITHNLTGLFGVMDGVSSDLRTGLPAQMIEIHEAMRLLVIVEAKTETVAEIYGRQPALQELIGNGWLLAAVKDPDSSKIELFNPSKGFETWQTPLQPLDEVPRSADWYRGHYGHLTPALVTANAVKEV